MKIHLPALLKYNCLELAGQALRGASRSQLGPDEPCVHLSYPADLPICTRL